MSSELTQWMMLMAVIVSSRKKTYSMLYSVLSTVLQLQYRESRTFWLKKIVELMLSFVIVDE